MKRYFLNISFRYGHDKRSWNAINFCNFKKNYLFWFAANIVLEVCKCWRTYLTMLNWRKTIFIDNLFSCAICLKFVESPSPPPLFYILIFYTPASAPLQRCYGVVTVFKKYQNFKKIGDGYVIAATHSPLPPWIRQCT